LRFVGRSVLRSVASRFAGRPIVVVAGGSLAENRHRAGSHPAYCGARPGTGSVSPMAECRITCVDGGTIDVRGELEDVVGEFHRVFTRREHTFAILHDLSGTPVAVRPEAVLHVRPGEAVAPAPEAGA
jgi:hypothetical protein